MSYTYTDADFLNASQINIEDLQNEIKESSITTANVLYVTNNQTDVTFEVEIVFDGALSAPDLITLDGIIANYVYVVYTDTFATIKDIKSPGTNGGTFTSGSWQKRTVNTIEGNVNFVAIASDQLTLQPGTYVILIKATACDVRNHQCRLQNITDTVSVLGTNSYSYNGVMTSSDVYTILTISDVKVFEIQHICSDTSDNIGFGKATGFNSNELYTIATIQKIA